MIEKLRLPLALQMGTVVVLFTGALGTLWYTSSSVVVREERRTLANNRLKQATDILKSQGKTAFAQLRPYPEYTEAEEWAAIERLLADAIRTVRQRFPDIEGGYYVPERREASFLPSMPEGSSATDDAEEPQFASINNAKSRNLYDYVETQADAAYRKKYALLVVEEVAPETIAIEAAPVRVDGRVVASAWTMTRLVDPVFYDRPSAGYRLFAALTLLGIALSMGLTFNLVRTIRRQAVERDRLQLELRRSERLAALGRLLAGVAHEVRNPLAGIRSTAQLWQRGLGIGAESIDGLVLEVDRLELIVSSLLQFSRADAQDLVPGDLNTVLTEAARLAEHQAGAKGIRLTIDLDRSLPPVLMAPPALLQVFRNLTTNAIQATSKGGTIRLSSQNDPGQRTVTATVADTGSGLSPEALDHLFEPFFTTKAEGTGLGLAIAREIAMAHRGELRASNQGDSSGAVFRLSLPVASSLHAGELP